MMPLQDGGQSGQRMSLRMARTAAPAHRRSLEVIRQPTEVPAHHAPADIAPPDVELAHSRPEQARGIILAPSAMAPPDTDARQGAADIRPLDAVPAELPAEQAPADIAAPDTVLADTPAEERERDELVVKGSSREEQLVGNVVPEGVPAQQPPNVMALPDEVRCVTLALQQIHTPIHVPRPLCTMLLPCSHPCCDHSRCMATQHLQLTHPGLR